MAVICRGFDYTVFMNTQKLVYVMLLLWGLLLSLVGCGPAGEGVALPTAVSAPNAETETETGASRRPTPTADSSLPYPAGEVGQNGAYPLPLAPTAVPRPTLYPAGTIPGVDAEVLFVSATETAPNVWTFEVTVAHPDEGPDHYANGWDVVLPDNTVLKVDIADQFTRVLLHPHVDEQPFTRSQTGLVIPAGTTRVYVRAHDNVHGYGNPVLVDLTTAVGDRYTVTRLAQE